ncbi:RidA family protein [Amycolatopsis sp. GM8]|uniref:RidA family protein n=1 Tax=Amycolatopsis sp. GM8 TaxID=2896530 RepID=UPI001F21D796|nr:RidA family protein [Amycolatopsis sp. GM8]
MEIAHIDPTPGAKYTPAVVGAGLVFTSGQVGEDPETGAVPDGFDDEVRLALANLEAVLVAAGSRLSHLVKITCYIADVELADTFNRIYLDSVPEPRPARATVQVRMLAPYRIELDCVAALADPATN